MRRWIALILAMGCTLLVLAVHPSGPPGQNSRVLAEAPPTPTPPAPLTPRIYDPPAPPALPLPAGDPASDRPIQIADVGGYPRIVKL